MPETYQLTHHHHLNHNLLIVLLQSCLLLNIFRVWFISYLLKIKSYGTEIFNYS
jgi:hypothetical protein